MFDATPSYSIIRLVSVIQLTGLSRSTIYDCSGQVKLATVLESFQYKRSDSFGVNPPLY
ncbi:AlpA family phage regulatory protein [Shewanella sp. SACH]|uniref:AlpA family phage regulatory protein n=1 Tax=Shewanella sp. SACH TaxID=1873135 RepID=UPI001123D72B|nr:AlpA family phage regulatory protein [Shewanella sp. SACH]